MEQPDQLPRTDDPLEELLLFWNHIQAALQRVFPDRNVGTAQPPKLYKFLESHISWGSVGLILGSVESPWAKIWLPIAYIFMVISIWRVNFFSGFQKKVEVAGNFIAVIVLMFAFLGIWHVVPKHATKEEIADEVVRRLQPTVVGMKPTQQPVSDASETAELVVKRLNEQGRTGAQQVSIAPIPPISNNELRHEVLAYTEKLRDMNDRIGRLWGNNMMKPINLQPGQNERTQRWMDGERMVEDEFHENYLEKGIKLRDELRRRLHQVGLPPVDALDGKPFSAPEMTHPLSNLADYLDGLANNLPYP